MASGRECLHRKIVIFASELASAVGRHRYVSREETFRKVWLRSHQQSFCFAHAMQFKKEVYLIMSENEALKLRFPNLVEEKENTDFVAALKQVICDHQLRHLYRQILSFLKSQVSRSAKEEQLLDSAKILDQVDPEVRTLCENETKPVESVVKEMCAKAGVKKKEVIEALESKITKDRGTQLESKAVEDFGTAKGFKIERPVAPELFYREMEYDEVKWLVCGKVDAEIEDSVIEVKNRKNHFMCPEYDYIQLQTYLFICKKSKGILVERLRGENKETCFHFDEERWKELTVELAKFVAELSSAIADTKEVLYGQSSTRKREHGKAAQSATEQVGCQVPEKKIAVDETCTAENEEKENESKFDQVE